MSDEMRDARREAGGARFSEAIDGAVREMLAVEPPPQLRDRVLARIEAQSVGRAGTTFAVTNPVVSTVRRNSWIAVPVATAALIVVAVLVPWQQAVQPAATAPSTIASGHPDTVAVPLDATKPRFRPTTKALSVPRVKPVDRAQRSIRQGVVAAAATDAGMDVLFTRVEPLPGPPSILVERLVSPPPSGLSGLGLAPLEIRALELTPLTETPKQRRQE